MSRTRLFKLLHQISVVTTGIMLRKRTRNCGKGKPPCLHTCLNTWLTFYFEVPQRQKPNSLNNWNLNQRIRNDISFEFCQVLEIFWEKYRQSTKNILQNLQKKTTVMSVLKKPLINMVKKKKRFKTRWQGRRHSFSGKQNIQISRDLQVLYYGIYISIWQARWQFLNSANCLHDCL